MPVYKYTIKSNGGKDTGIATAETAADVERDLKKRKLIILKIEEMKERTANPAYATLRERSDTEKTMAGYMIPRKKTEQALLQLGTLLRAGVPILSAIRTVAAQSPAMLSRALYCVANKVHDGSTLTAALRKEAGFLGDVIIGLIAAGEANGSVDRMCDYAASLMAGRRELRGNMIQAMVYPAIVIATTVGIVIFLMHKVIPKIIKFISARSGKLPAITQALVDVSAFLQDYGVYLLIVPALAVAAVVLGRRNKEIGIEIDRLSLRIPLLGKAFASSANALWGRTMGILLSSGINIVDALEFTIGSVGNMHYRDEIGKIKSLVKQGHPLSTGIRATEIGRYSPFTEAMVTVGENTGHMDESLARVAEFSELELKERIGLLSKLIEPALFVVVGGIVGFVYIAFFIALVAATTGQH